MTNRQKALDIKKRNTVRKRLPGDLEPITGERFRFTAAGLLALPLSILLFFSGTAIIRGFSITFLNTLPGLLSGATPTLLAMAGFSALYIYKGIIKSSRHTLDNITAYTLSLLTVVTVLFMTFNSRQTCMFAGGNIDCSEAQLLIFYFVFLNPLIMPVVLVLSIIGIVSLISRHSTSN
jgi:hypothetical protein